MELNVKEAKGADRDPWFVRCISRVEEVLAEQPIERLFYNEDRERVECYTPATAFYITEDAWTSPDIEDLLAKRNEIGEDVLYPLDKQKERLKRTK